MDPAWAALGGEFIGASAGIIGGVALEMFKRRRDRQGAASAIAGEIASVLFMSHRRGHQEYFEILLPELEAGHEVSIPERLAPDGDRLDPVADRYIDRRGLLPADCAERVVRFYTLLPGIRGDIRRMGLGEFKGRPEEMAEVIRQNLALWSETKRIGDRILNDLRKIAARHRRINELEMWTEERWLGGRVSVPGQAKTSPYQRVRAWLVNRSSPSYSRRQ